MKKRYKAIFGNPPYSVDIKECGGKPKLLWNRFSAESIKQAEEVYYVTPYIWNGNNKQMIRDEQVYNVDLDAAKEFKAYSSICYWNTHKKDKRTIKANGKTITFDKLSDIEYLPYDVNNTLPIHMKLWDKEKMGLYDRGVLARSSDRDKISKVQSEEYPYKFFYSSQDRFFYVNEEGLNLYGKELYNTPKLILGVFTDNRPYIDRVGECGSILGSYILVDTLKNLEIRKIQLQSKMAKFFMATARQMKNNKPAIYVYYKAAKLFPNIPLHITDDGEIYRYFNLTDDEVMIVEKYADISTQGDYKRELKAKNKGDNYELF